jgi:hypothetical protein
MKALHCKYCGSNPTIREGLMRDWSIECSNQNTCRARIRIYSGVKRCAVEAWNNSNVNDKGIAK